MKVQITKQKKTLTKNGPKPMKKIGMEETSTSDRKFRERFVDNNTNKKVCYNSKDTVVETFTIYFPLVGHF